MWINAKEQKPKGEGAYHVYGKINAGTEHEKECKFMAHWLGEKYGWGDQDGEDLTCINEGVKFWFDFSKIPNPI